MPYLQIDYKDRYLPVELKDVRNGVSICCKFCKKELLFKPITSGMTMRLEYGFNFPPKYEYSHFHRDHLSYVLEKKASDYQSLVIVLKRKSDCIITAEVGYKKKE